MDETHYINFMTEAVADLQMQKYYCTAVHAVNKMIELDLTQEKRARWLTLVYNSTRFRALATMPLVSSHRMSTCVHTLHRTKAEQHAPGTDEPAQHCYRVAPVPSVRYSYSMTVTKPRNKFERIDSSNVRKCRCTIRRRKGCRRERAAFHRYIAIALSVMCFSY